MFVLAIKVEEIGSRESKEIFLGTYPTLVHIIGGAIIFMLFAGVIRTFTYKEFEWANAVGNDQVPAIIVKHIFLGGIFFYGVVLWVKSHKKVKEMRKELAAGR